MTHDCRAESWPTLGFHDAQFDGSFYAELIGEVFDKQIASHVSLGQGQGRAASANAQRGRLEAGHA